MGTERWRRLPRRALLAGDPRRSRALAMLLVRAHPEARRWAAIEEVRGLFWEGELARAVRHARALRSNAGIKWRVLVISGCESGVFIGPLQDEFTLIATAAADDRNSYGCAMGNAYTDFGRAVFGDQLVREHSFDKAFGGAVLAIDRAEQTQNLRPSRPQLFEGPAMRSKLRAWESQASQPAP